MAVSLMHGQPFAVDREEFQSWPAKAQCATAALLHLAGLDIDDMRDLIFGRHHVYAWVYETDSQGRKYVWGRHGHDVAYRLEEVEL